MAPYAVPRGAPCGAVQVYPVIAAEDPSTLPAVAGQAWRERVLHQKLNYRTAKQGIDVLCADYQHFLCQLVNFLLAFED